MRLGRSPLTGSNPVPSALRGTNLTPPRPSNLSSELVELSHLALATTKAMILSAPYLRSVRAASLIVAPLV